MKRLYTILAGFLILIGCATAQNISYKETTLKRHGHDVQVYTNADLTNLDLKSSHMLLLSPMIISNDGKYQNVMTPIAVCGANRYKALRREIALGNADPALASAQVIRYLKSEQTPITINQTTPYQSWMEQSKVVIREQVIGCADCNKTDNSSPLISFRDPANASYVLNYIAPAEEGSKVRTVRLDAYVNFVIDRSELKRDYKKNKEELTKIEDFVNTYSTNGQLKVDEMTVSGYASPEAPIDYNLALSERRAKAVADYLRSKYGDMLPSLVVRGCGEDWTRLRELVAGSDMKNKQEVLDIIDDNKHADLDRKEEILSRHSAYAYLVKNFYPVCRRNDVKVDFTAQAFTLEEARKYIETQPELLSDAEMYRVAESYPAGSAERYRAFSTAHKFFPRSVTARVNLAIYHIENKQSQAAITLLEPIADQRDVNGVLGVAYARAGQAAKAEQALRKAAKEGDAVAQQNLKLFLES